MSLADGMVSFHVAIRKWISASDQLGERLLVPALFTSLESSSTRLELWYWVMTIVGKSDRVNMGCCSKNSLCQSGKMYGPRTASPTLITHWWNNKGWPKQSICYVRWLLCISYASRLRKLTLLDWSLAWWRNASWIVRIIAGIHIALLSLGKKCLRRQK